MAGFAGHAVFPNLYRDMKDPIKYPILLDTSYAIVLIIYLVIGSVGYCMFGLDSQQEITQNLPLVSNFNPTLTKITVGLVALNPLTKYPLNVNPVNYTLQRVIAPFMGSSPISSRILACLLSSIIVLFISIYFPGFHHVMALLGSFFSFMVSVVFPVLVYLVLYGSGLSSLEWLTELMVMALGIVFGLVGTIWVRSIFLMKLFL